MKKETYLKLKVQKRKAKLLALFTALSIFGSITKENKVNAKESEISNYEQMVIDKIIKYSGSDYSIGNNIVEDSNITAISTEINVESENVDTSGVTDEIVKYAKKGYTDGPEAYETFYDLNMSKVVYNLEHSFGFTDIIYEIRNDGVKILSGTRSDGVSFEDLVMVAADVRHPAANPDGTFERGQFVDTSLGKGIVVDACGEAISKRKYNKGVHFDIATAWHSQPYESMVYGKKNKDIQKDEKKYSKDKIVMPPGIVFDSERYISAVEYSKSK